MIVPVIFVLVACVHASVGAYVLWVRHTNATHHAFFAYSMGAALWIGGFGLFLSTHSDVMLSVLNTGGLLILFGFLRLVETLPEKHAAIRIHPFYYIPFIPGLFVTLYPGLLITDVTFSEAGVTPTQGDIFVYYAIAVVAYALCAVVLLWRVYRASSAGSRVQLQYFVLGNVTFVLLAALFDLVLPAMGVFSLNLLGPLASIIAVGATAYAIVRHELMDIRVVIQRGAIYLFILALVTGLYIAVVYMLGFLLGSMSPEAYYVSAGVTTIAGIFGVPIIERFFRKSTNRFFFKDPYDYARALQELSDVLHRNIELSAMMAGVRAVFEQVFHPESIDIEHDGRVVLGPKRSGDPYSAQDRGLLETFSHLAGTAFERGRLYEQVKQHAAELEEKVDERTRELRMTKESQEQMMLEISHNLQTPLTILRFKLESLKRAAPHDESIGAFEQSLDGLSQFIYDLMMLAKLEHADDSRQSVQDMGTLVHDIAEEIGTIASARGITVHCNAESGSRIECNPGQMRQALMNVASNAIKYMKVDGVKEIVFTVIRSAERVKVSIADTGIGISADEATRVFERFYRAQTVRHDVHGSGLGLAIVKRIVELNGGEISLESESGKGTTVTMVFPSL